jgi:hypothetical protein
MKPIKTAARFALVASAGLLLASAAAAQFGRSGPPSMHGVWHPTVGAGAAYDVTSAKGKPSSLEMAIVGKATIDGKDGYWLELTMTDSGGSGSFVMKEFMVTDGSNNRLLKMIMQMPGSPPMEMTQMMASYGSKSTQSADIRTQSDDLGSESVTTPAGTFACEHFRAKDGSGDVWISDKVSPWGMVKWQGKESTMVLARLITGAKDKITGTPVPFNPANFGQQGQNPQ